MERDEIHERGPQYYAIALLDCFFHNGVKEAHEDEIIAYYNDAGTPNLLGNCELLDRATEWLVQERLVTLIEDDFAGSMLIPADYFAQCYNDLMRQKIAPLMTCGRLRNGDQWVRKALSGVNHQVWMLGATASLRNMPQPVETEEARATEDEWEPLPLDRKVPIFRP